MSYLGFLRPSWPPKRLLGLWALVWSPGEGYSLGSLFFIQFILHEEIQESNPRQRSSLLNYWIYLHSIGLLILKSVLYLAVVERSIYSYILFNLVIWITLHWDHLDLFQISGDKGWWDFYVGSSQGNRITHWQKTKMLHRINSMVVLLSFLWQDFLYITESHEHVNLLFLSAEIMSLSTYPTHRAFYSVILNIWGK